MLNKEKHKFILINILKEIYSNPYLRNVLGFKGGTAAFLFYDLPRLSVDLDFDLLRVEKINFVFEELKKVLSKFGKLEEAREKRYTLFYLLNYGKGERKVKIEISKRKTFSSFEGKGYLGIPILVIKKEDMVAGKICALLTRKNLASRDLFDLLFFLKQGWDINQEIVEKRTSLSFREALRRALKIVGRIPKNKILNGIGELVDEKQKPIIKERLKEELIFQLRLRLEMGKN